MTPALSLGAAILSGAVLLGACSSDEAIRTDGPDPVRSTSLSQCADVLPTDLVDRLGWADAVGPRLDGGTCTLTSDDGDLAVRRWPVAAVGEDDLPEAAREAFEGRCQDLHGDAAEQVDWLGDLPACAVSAAQGQNTLLGLTPEHTLIEARVYTNDRTDAALMQDALVTMVRAAAETF